MADPAPLCFRLLPGGWLPRWFRPVCWKGAACPLASLRFRKPQTTALRTADPAAAALHPGTNKALWLMGRATEFSVLGFVQWVAAPMVMVISSSLPGVGLKALVGVLRQTPQAFRTPWNMGREWPLKCSVLPREIQPGVCVHVRACMHAFV